MSTYSVADAKAHLSNLIERAIEGEAVVISRHGQPVVELRAVARAVKPMSGAALDQLMNSRAIPNRAGWSSAELIRRMRDEGA